MTTRKKSEALKFLEEASGRPLSFAAMLESIRKGQEISLNAFAKKLNISPSHLCDIEKGRKIVSATRAAAFANILERSPSQFVRLALQDEMERAGLKLKISVQNA